MSAPLYCRAANMVGRERRRRRGTRMLGIRERIVVTAGILRWGSTVEPIVVGMWCAASLRSLGLAISWYDNLLA